MIDIASVKIVPNKKYLFVSKESLRLGRKNISIISEGWQSDEIAIIIHKDGSTSIFPFSLSLIIHNSGFKGLEEEGLHCIESIDSLSELYEYADNLIDMGYVLDERDALNKIAKSVKKVPELKLDNSVRKCLIEYM